jgi:hypothetical protein
VKISYLYINQKAMSKILLAAICIMGFNHSFSQCIKVVTSPDIHPSVSGNPSNDILREQYSGKLFRITSVETVSGSPFLFDNWRSGTVITSTARYDNVMLKYNTVKDKFYFNRNDSIYELPDDVIEVRIKEDEYFTDDTHDMKFKKVLNGTDKVKEGSFVQVLCVGRVSLFKQYIKRVEGENFTNGIFATVKQIVSHNNLWATVSDQTIAIKPNSHFLEKLTADKTSEIQNLIKSRKLNIKDEKNFATAIAYYNVAVESNNQLRNNVTR